MRILYIDIDSLRPDHLGCYGYHRKTSPHIDALAAESAVFENHYTSDAPCLPSRTAFYTGRFGLHSGVVGHGGTASTPRIQGPGRGFFDWIDLHGLAGRLQRAGLRTSMISTFGQRHSAHWYYAGFNEVHNIGERGMESAEAVWPTIDRWLSANATSDNWFLHVNLWDPHTPYRVPESFGHPFANEPLPAWLTDEVFQAHLGVTGPHTAQDIGMYSGTPEGAGKYPRHPWTLKTREDLRKLIDGYDTGVLYADHYIGLLLNRLKEAGVYEETAVILSADHGENLGELGIYAEHGTADDPTTRVPLLVRWPGLPALRATGLHYHLDLAPTLLDLLGAKPSELWDGQSFADVLRGTLPPSTGREDLVIGQCAHVAQRAVRWDRWLYLRTYHDGFRLLPAELLFDLKADPHEEHDLAPQRPDILREGAWRLARWHDAQMQRLAREGNDVIDPLWTVVREGGPFHARLTAPGNPGSIQGFNTYLARLEATQRGDGADALRRRVIDGTYRYQP